MPDIVVIGSGGAGLLAACVAADSGLSVQVLERSPVLGGSTAVSGGQLWIPNNDLMRAAGLDDSLDEAVTYLKAISCGRTDSDVLASFAGRAPEMVRWLENTTSARFQIFPRPDYHPEFPGSKLAGRVLDPMALDAENLGTFRQLVRDRPTPIPLTGNERYALKLGGQVDASLVRDRLERGTFTQGGTLVAALLGACIEREVTFSTNVRAEQLIIEDRRVRGVVARSTRVERVAAERGVVLASGGFEWNSGMKATFLRAPDKNPVSPPWNEGDAVWMALEAEAALGNMTEAWWYPTYNIPGEAYDGRPLARMLSDERSSPGSIIVNRSGRRFVNEAMNYNDMAMALHVFDPSTYDRPNVPAWLLFDAAFKRTYSVATVSDHDPAPAWFATSNTLEALARRLGIDPVGLSSEVQSFNVDASAGVDRTFGRGSNAYDRFQGDPSHEPNPCLAPIAEPPYFAIPVIPGSLGTKGGPLTDADGKVLDRQGLPIRGLYACGNAAASIMGPGYPGAGGTLGPGLTFAYAIGRSLRSN
jgi:succinate dehydrogenase/fumarate reductase flavoprotein subunit